MATNQTTNYQLNQWEPTDQVLRTDFNADNAKIDAALDGKVTRAVLLDLVLAEDQQTVSLGVSGLAWGDYLSVLLHITPGVSRNAILRVIPKDSGGNSGGSHFRLSGMTDTEYSGLGEISLDEPGMMYLLTMGSSNNFVTALSFGYRYFNYGTASQFRFQQVHTLELQSRESRYPVSAGSRIQLLGLR